MELRPLELPSLESYGAIILTILIAVLPMTSWLHLILILIGLALVIDVVWRSRWTISLRFCHKVLISCGIAAIVVCGWLLAREPAQSKPTQGSNAGETAATPHESESLKKPAISPKHKGGVASTPNPSQTPLAKTTQATSPPLVGTMTIQPGGVVSVGQQGGITAGQVNLNPEPELLASAQIQKETGNQEMPWMTAFSIKATSDVLTGDLRLKCTGQVIKAGIGRINPYSFSSGSNGPDPDDPTIVVYQLGPEPLSRGREVSVAVYSKVPVTVLSGTIGTHRIRFQ